MNEITFQSFPSITDYRNAVKAVKQHVSYAGKDENGDPIFKHTIAPKLRYIGSVKLHGTNSAIVQNGAGDMWFQSRNNIITPESDNAGFARYMTEQVTKDRLKNLFDEVRKLPMVEEIDTVAIFGEWCGSSIQKGVAISQLPKMFVIFAIRVGNEEESFWLSFEDVSTIKDNDKQIFNIFDFPCFFLQIDFENPQLTQNTLVDFTLAVEKECPVGKQFGVSGIGEGIVWRCIEPYFNSSKFVFKVKGKEHSPTKVKTIAAIDIERVNSIKELVGNVVTEQRCNQGIEYLNEQHLEVDVKNIGPFLKWVSNDVFKEELDMITENGFTQKEVGKEVSNAARQWFLSKLTF